MERTQDIIKDLRVAALAPAIAGHAIAFGLFMTVFATDEVKTIEPAVVDFVLVDPDITEWPVLPEPETATSTDPDQAGSTRDPDPRLGDPEGGAIEQSAIRQDALFEAFSGVDAAEAVVPSQVSEARDALQSGLMGDGGDQLSAIRVALRRQACRKLTEKPDPTCPDIDPFVEHYEVAQLRAMPALLRAQQPGRLVQADFSVERWQDSKFVQADLPAGMDASLFTAPMAAGAYSALRIQNGQAPLWQYGFENDLAQRTAVN